ncbi:MAG: aminopeptidase P family protein [Candidatus Jidaibacter sp.]|jgi:Xaa-Pro aminopeptidase|nr:aminopeptidase P family protein [Candidatus Jidaibacter sp.]
MIKENLTSLRELLKTLGVGGFIIPSNDEFMNEYVPEHLNRLKFFTSFSGSNGVAIITLESAFFFTDGRYLLQAKKQLGDLFEIFDMYDKSSCDHYHKLFKSVKKLGYDPMLHSQKNLDYYAKLASENEFEIVPLSSNPVDLLWNDKPNPPQSNVYYLDLKYAGLSSADKISSVLEALEHDSDSILFTHLDAICWLLNIRASDVDYNPFPLCYMMLDRSRNITLYIESGASRIDFDILDCKFVELSEAVTHIKNLGQKIQMDYSKTPVAFSSITNTINAKDPIEMMKACKNTIEQDGFRRAHFEDGLAIIKVLHELFTNQNSTYTEFSICEMLDKARGKRNNFVEPSFSSIVGYQENGAIIHYKAEKSTAKKIGNNGLILIDSGGHYLDGTTDITRTIHLGTPKPREKEMFTRVLKGHIQLAMAIFPIGTTGAHLDILARNALWQNGLNYQHGTGHGVGHFLSVHEGPQRISQSFTEAVALKEGMVISNEPGFYAEGEFGIRIESLLLVVKSKFDGFLEFETLTLAPLQKSLIAEAMLSNDEKAWINDYHSRIVHAYKNHLSEQELVWLNRYI